MTDHECVACSATATSCAAAFLDGDVCGCCSRCLHVEVRAYLDPVRDELDRLRAALAAADRRIADLTTERDSERAFLKQRSDALNATGASNDQLRATIARVESAANRLGSSLDPSHYARGQRDACVVIREALAALGES